MTGKHALHRCKSCGYEYELPRTPGIREVLALELFSSEDFTHTACLQCHVVDWASERRFFGTFGPEALQKILSGVAVLLVLWTLNVVFEQLSDL